MALSLLLVLYGYFYFTISRQEYSLLASSIGLFVILATLMYCTRKVDWYSFGGGAETSLDKLNTLVRPEAARQRSAADAGADLTIEEAPPASARVPSNNGERH